ncbi:MAG: family 78 glycoside hydrolase catalytic domain [Thermoguttaceae bacterium]
MIEEALIVRHWIAGGLAAVIVLISIAAVPARGADGGLAAPEGLRFDNQVEPLGMAIRQARFSWLVKDARRGAVQSAYRILVSTDSSVGETGPNLVWDSGIVASDRSIQVPYGGPALKSRQRYFWKVQTFDAAGAPSPWSAPSWWEMSPGPDEPWKSAWITMSRVPPAFVPDPDVFNISRAVMFRAATAQGTWRQQFILPHEGQVAKATLHVAATAPYVVYLDGKKAAAGDPTGADAKTLTIRQHDIASLLRNSLNTVALALADSAGNQPRMIVAAAEIRMADGSGLNLEADGEWRFNPTPEKDWEQPAFNDSQWQLAPTSGGISSKDAPKPLVRSQRTRRPIHLRKEFDLPSKPKRARVYVSAIGACELTINGKPASDDVFAPNREADRYVTYDVADLLVPGRNSIGATAAGGWAAGQDSGWGSWPRFFLQFEADTGDKSLVIVTDETWKVHPAPILDAANFSGEKYDARLEQAGWDQVGFDDRSWAPAAIGSARGKKFLPANVPPMRCTEQTAPVKVEKLADGVFRFDFGQNAAGVCTLDLRNAEPGRRITLTFGETPACDGSGAENTDVYICKGGPRETWRPRFTYRGFRYAKATNYPGTADARSLVRRVIHTDVRPVGGFACADDLVNRIWHNSVWSWRSNMYGAFTDCPQRRERSPWNGDAQISSHGCAYSFDISTFMDNFVARYGRGCGFAWTDVTTTGVWVLRQFYDDANAAERHYSAIKAMVDDRTKAAVDGLAKGFSFGDWGHPRGLKSDKMKQVIDQGYWLSSAQHLAEAARITGRKEDQAKYEALADAIRKTARERLLDRATGVIGDGGQTSQVIALKFGLVPEDLRQKAVAVLVKDIEDRGCHVDVGFVGIQHILPVLSDNGRHDVAWRLLTQDTFPSWGYMVKQGATTQWEYWPGRGSQNHHQFGCVNQWIMEYLAGLSSSEPGFKKILFAPDPIGGLPWAEAHHDSPHGRVAIRWERKDGVLRVTCTAPANTTATLLLPIRDTEAVREGETSAAKAPGVKLLGKVQHRGQSKMAFEFGSGTYDFAAPIP